MIINGSDGWGDSFPTLWFCEYLSSANNVKIDLLGGGSAESALNLSKRFKYEALRIIYNDLYGSPFSSNISLDQKDDFRSNFLGIRRFKKALNLLVKKPFHHSDYIEKPAYINKWLYKAPHVDYYDEILCTHHNHVETGQSWASPPFRDKLHGGLFPPINTWKKKVKLPKIRRMDLNSDLLNIIFREGFRPTMPRLKKVVLDELNAFPDQYICVQLRPKDSGPLDQKEPTRNFLSGEDYDEWAANFVNECYSKWKLPIVISSGEVKSDFAEIIDARHLSLWAKIQCHRKAQYSYVAHSGFGMIIAMYRELKDIKLINPSEKGIYRNPPALLFSNVQEKDSSILYSASPPGWVDQFKNWKINYEDALKP